MKFNWLSIRYVQRSKGDGPLPLSKDKSDMPGPLQGVSQ